MRHPYEILRPEYEKLLSTMRVLRPVEVNAAANRLIQTPNMMCYKEVADATGVPAALIAALDWRESSADPSRALGQGDRWDRVSVNEPRGLGPFKSRVDAAIFYVRRERLNDNSAPWSWPYVCWKAEAWNGFGPRNHSIHTGYLWGGTNHYRRGKYVRDGVWDPNHVDRQLGVIPVMMRVISLTQAIDPALAFDKAPAIDQVAPPTLVPVPSPVGVSGSSSKHNVKWLQDALNKVQQDALGQPLLIDGSYGRRTRYAVRTFQANHGLNIDGLFGPKTDAALTAALQGEAS